MEGLSKEEVLNILDETEEVSISKARKALDIAKDGSILGIYVSGWIQKLKDGSFRVDIWRGFEERESLEELAQQIRSNYDFLELYAKSLTPVKLLILLRAYQGATETELSEYVHLRGGALHYHIRDLTHLSLLRKEGRGRYITTKYGSFVVRTALSALRKFERSIEEAEF